MPGSPLEGMPAMGARRSDRWCGMHGKFFRPRPDGGRKELIADAKPMQPVEQSKKTDRYSNLIISQCKILYAIDASKICYEFLSNNFDSQVLKPLLPSELDKVTNDIDLVFTFDCMLHMNLYEIWWYLKNLCNKINRHSFFLQQPLLQKELNILPLFLIHIFS